jgi:hypothetical protein
MNLHRVSTHISPIASEIPCHARGPSWLLETASSSRAPSCRIKLEAHSLTVSKVAHAGLVKALPKKGKKLAGKKLAGSFVEPGQSKSSSSIRYREAFPRQQMRQ